MEKMKMKLNKLKMKSEKKRKKYNRLTDKDLYPKCMHHHLKISRIRFMRVLVRLVKNCVYFSYEKRKSERER